MAEQPEASNSPSPNQPTGPPRQRKRTGLVAEFWAYLRYSKKWWMTPILVVLLLLGGFVLLTATPLGPFIYALF
ncbi:MAG: hypothetical protein DWQ01_08920 [Planctomycetota bacterium]|nr:MAG: hypothetical protein DWQ01_08920 [Planctomycetota bacterium]